MAVAEGSGGMKLSNQSMKDIEVLETKVIDKIRTIAKDTTKDGLYIESLSNNMVNQLSVEDIEILEGTPTITITTELGTDVVNALRTLANSNDTTLREQLENAVIEYDTTKKEYNFDNLVFRSKALPKCKYNIIMNFRKIADKIGERPQIESHEVMKIIVEAIPNVNEVRARQEYLKTMQNYSLKVNSTKQVEILNLVGFTHKIDQIMTKFHGFKVGF